MRKGIASLAAFALALSLSVPAWAGAPEPATAEAAKEAVPYQTLTGTITRSDYEQYRQVPFDLPAGVTSGLRDALDGRQAEAAIGLRNRWKLGRGWSLSTGYERVHVVGHSMGGKIAYLSGKYIYTLSYSMPRDDDDDALLAVATFEAARGSD